MATTTTSRYYSSTRSRSRSPSTPRTILFTPRDQDEEDRIIRNMCRPPPGWPSTGGVPPADPIPRSGITSRPSRWRDGFVDSKEPPSIVSQNFDRTWKKMENEVESMHSYMDNFVHKMDNLFTDSLSKKVDFKTPPKPASDPLNNVVIDSSIATPEAVQYVDATGERRLVYSLDLSGFRPEDIKVNLCTDNGMVTVEAVHEERDKAHYFKRYYSRKFQVPDDMRSTITQQAFKSFLNDQGTLSIEAPLPPKLGEGTGRQQPVGACRHDYSGIGSSKGPMSGVQTYRDRCLPGYYNDVINVSTTSRSTTMGDNASGHCRTCHCENDKI